MCIIYMTGVKSVDVTPTMENVEVNPTMKDVDVTSTILKNTTWINNSHAIGNHLLLYTIF